MNRITLEQVRAALALDNFDVLAAQRGMAPNPRRLRRHEDQSGKARKASVLLLLYPATNGLTFVLTHRAQNPHDKHSGQISLPGGSREGGETPAQTALREANEEVGVSVPIQVLGELTCLYIPPSDFRVRSVVGYSAVRPTWRLSAAEVVEVIECPVAWLLDEDHKMAEDRSFGGHTMHVPFYEIEGHKVWGATAIILSEFEQRLRAVCDSVDKA